MAFSVSLSGIGSFVAVAAISGLIGHYAAKTSDAAFAAVLTGDLSGLGSKSEDPSGTVDDIQLFDVLTVSSELNDNAAAESEKWTDLTLFVCADSTRGASDARKIANRALDLSFGSIKQASIAPSPQFEHIIGGSVAVIYDANHPERGELTGLVKLLGETLENPPMVVLPNSGKATPWRVSLFFCT